MLRSDCPSCAPPSPTARRSSLRARGARIRAVSSPRCMRRCSCLAGKPSVPDRHIRARKRFGQHFLHDPAVVRRILAAVSARADGPIVEIGPGRGALTQLLLELNGSLDAIEIDRDLAGTLRERFARAPRFVLHETDALDFDFAALARERGA